ncbi:MAG TPA: DASS family sodium-coupled anion symporter [Pseudomonadales bacterium]
MHAWIKALVVLLLASSTLMVDAPAEVRAGLFVFVLIGGLWLTEAFHLTLTALLVPVLAIAFGLMDVRTALGYFAHPVIAIFFGGFALASALQAQGLDAWIARSLLRLARGSLRGGVLLLFCATALLSMWISNTATAAMMLPLALGLLREHPPQEQPDLYVFVLLGVAWSASMGGVATLVGSPPNAIAAAELQWGFAEWMAVGLPLFLLLYPLAILTLWRVIKPVFPDSAPLHHDASFHWHAHRIITLLIFMLTVLLWVFGEPLMQGMGIAEDKDSVVALLAAVLLGMTGCTQWKQIARDTNWGVLLLFGGGIALSALMKVSGASAFLGQLIGAGLPVDQPLLFVAMVTLFVVFLTELVSNTASAALLIPLLLPIGAGMGVDPAALVVLIAVSASCAFMLPVATPPNALVYGTGLVPAAVMRRTGLVMNLLAVVVLTLWFGLSP